MNKQIKRTLSCYRRVAGERFCLKVASSFRYYITMGNKSILTGLSSVPVAVALTLMLWERALRLNENNKNKLSVGHEDLLAA